MQTLGLAMKTSENEGSALPPVFPSLDNNGVKFRRGTLALIAGAPGGFKSAIATAYAANAVYEEYDEEGVPISSVGIPTLYFSADTDKKTLGTRVAANITKYTVDQAEGFLDSGNESVWNQLEAQTSHIWFSWDRSPTLDDFSDEVRAFAHSMGDYPHIIVVDNLKNVWIDESGEGGEHVRYDRVLDFLHELAGITNALILVLHHVTGNHENGNQPIPLTGILGKVTKPFRLILTLHKRWDGTLGVCVVKQTAGRASADGTFVIAMPFDPERMQFDFVQEGVNEYAQ